MWSLIKTIQTRDPAKPTVFEVVLGYPGFHAIMLHYPAKWLWKIRLRALARFWANLARILTGIEIHPGATIGRNVFIDHGTGVVIGETAVVGDCTTLYHNVTLGGLAQGSVDGKRHPTLGTNVIIGAGAHILGNIHIGDHARVGANSVVIGDVPKDATAIGVPARLAGQQRKTGEDGPDAYGICKQGNIDPLADIIEKLVEDVETLKRQNDKS